jgi:hypothetical protein
MDDMIFLLRPNDINDKSKFSMSLTKSNLRFQSETERGVKNLNCTGLFFILLLMYLF